jgi:hypothetical protein
MRTGRPKVVIDLEQAEKLGQLQCTYKECAAFLNVDESTLKGRGDFLTAFKKGQEVGKISLRRTQFRLAEKSAGMAIWLGKQYLGQTEKFDVGAEEWVKHPIRLVAVSGNGHGKEDALERYKGLVN